MSSIDTLFRTCDFFTHTYFSCNVLYEPVLSLIVDIYFIHNLLVSGSVLTDFDPGSLIIL